LKDFTLLCIGNEEDNITLTCTLSEDYPQTRPLWFNAGDDDIEPVSEVLEEFNSEIDEEKLEQMIKVLLARLCDAFRLHNPDHEVTASGDHNNESLETMQCDSDEEDVDVILDEVPSMESEDGIAKEKLKKLELIRQKQKPSAKSSPQATDRLMKDIKSIYKSESYKKEKYSVELQDDNVYEWRVALLEVDPESKLAKDMKEFKVSKIELSINFAHDYPFRPPFVRVVAPVIQRGYVLSGGAICLELLTEEGWSSAYSMESVIMQIGASLVKGEGRIIPNKRPEDVYTLSKAKNSYKNLVQIHKTSGWYTPPKADG